MFEYKKLKMNLESYLRDKEAIKDTCCGFIPNTFGVLLPLKKDKCKHYWLWSSSPNKGKTTFLKDLDLKYKCSWYNYQESFQSIRKGT